jgi:hypothetical protein
MKADLYDSMASAAAGEGISLELVRRAKRAGCVAFRGSRVDGAALRKFIAERGDTLAQDGGSLKEEKTKEEIRKLRLRNDRDEGKVVMRTEIAMKLRTALGRMRGVLEQKIVNQLPADAAMLEAPEIRIIGRKILDEAMQECACLDAELT